LQVQLLCPVLAALGYAVASMPANRPSQFSGSVHTSKCIMGCCCAVFPGTIGALNNGYGVLGVLPGGFAVTAEV
jgi:hypothetical protein